MLRTVSAKLNRRRTLGTSKVFSFPDEQETKAADKENVCNKQNTYGVLDVNSPRGQKRILKPALAPTNKKRKKGIRRRVSFSHIVNVRHYEKNNEVAEVDTVAEETKTKAPEGIMEAESMDVDLKTKPKNNEVAEVNIVAEETKTKVPEGIMDTESRDVKLRPDPVEEEEGAEEEKEDNEKEEKEEEKEEVEEGEEEEEADARVTEEIENDETDFIMSKINFGQFQTDSINKIRELKEVDLEVVTAEVGSLVETEAAVVVEEGKDRDDDEEEEEIENDETDFIMSKINFAQCQTSSIDDQPPRRLQQPVVETDKSRVQKTPIVHEQVQANAVEVEDLEEEKFEEEKGKVVEEEEKGKVVEEEEKQVLVEEEKQVLVEEEEKDEEEEEEKGDNMKLQSYSTEVDAIVHEGIPQSHYVETITTTPKDACMNMDNIEEQVDMAVEPTPIGGAEGEETCLESENDKTDYILSKINFSQSCQSVMNNQPVSKEETELRQESEPDDLLDTLVSQVLERENDQTDFIMSKINFSQCQNALREDKIPEVVAPEVSTKVTRTAQEETKDEPVDDNQETVKQGIYIIRYRQCIRVCMSCG